MFLCQPKVNYSTPFTNCTIRSPKLCVEYSNISNMHANAYNLSISFFLFFVLLFYWKKYMGTGSTNENTKREESNFRYLKNPKKKKKEKKKGTAAQHRHILSMISEAPSCLFHGSWTTFKCPTYRLTPNAWHISPLCTKTLSPEFQQWQNCSHNHQLNSKPKTSNHSSLATS